MPALPIVATVAAVAGTAMGAYSAVSSAQNAKAAADYNAQVEQNAALDAQQRGAVAAVEHDQQTRQLIARQNAAMSAGGLDTASGTPLDILTGTAGMGKLDSLRILNNAQRTADGFQAQAGLDLYKGNAAGTAGYYGAAGTILGGVGNSITGYYGTRNAMAADSSD